MELWGIRTAGDILGVSLLLGACEIAAVVAFAPATRRVWTGLTLGMMLFVWHYIALTRALGLPYPAPTFSLLLGAPILLATAALALLPGWRATMAAIPLHWLIGMQVLRVVGGVFLIGLANGALPRHFAIPAGYGDVATGLLAIPTAWAVAKRVRGWKAIAWCFGLFGLADLVVAVGIGTGLLAPLAIELFGTSAVTSSTNLGGFPLSLIPSFLVPQAVILHLYVFWRLVRPSV